VEQLEVVAAMKPRRRGHRARYWPLYALIAITVVPIVAAYIAYYVRPPAARTNYGTLIDPQRPVPPLPLKLVDGTPFSLQELKGRWVFVMVDGGDCDARCADKLLMMRQQRAMTGRNRDQIERVWLIIDDAPLPIMLMREYEGTHFVRAPLPTVRAFLPLPPMPDVRLEDHLWMIDPAGNLMLRWPRDAEADGIKRDVARLLKVASGWIRIEPRTRQ
jgi:hypothetical protein